MSRRARSTFFLLLASLAPAVVAQQQTVGLFVNDDPSPGYTLFSPIGTPNSYLINNDGLLVNSWVGTARPGLMAYFTETGTLLRSTKFLGGPPGGFPQAGGSGGRYEEYDWDGNLIWEYEYGTADHLGHHDIQRMPGGNILIIAWELLPDQDAIDAGMNPANIFPNQLIDSIVEVQPTPPIGGTIVWEWRVADHLIQDFDPTKANFGVVADHPELIDINFPVRRDLAHFNAVDYHPGFDQIVISANAYDEVWVIDHSTTTAEAMGHTGGTYGKGGDLLYRWGNPQAYGRGNAGDQILFGQHDAQWIAPGLPSAGNMLAFNNQQLGPGGDFSSVEEFTPPVDINGNYPIAAGQPFGPAAATWTYQANPPESFHSSTTSGAFRLPNGNTLTTLGMSGRMIEVESDGTTTWEYQNPDTGQGLVEQGQPFSNSGVFKARRYSPGYPGLAGKDLTPGDPVELFTRPAPLAAGSLRANKITPGATHLELTWGDGGCPSFDYHVLYGDLANAATATIDGALCDVGTAGTALWSGVPATSLFFLVVGTDLTGVYESGWGNGRGATKASLQCGTTTKVLDPQCP